MAEGRGRELRLRESCLSMEGEGSVMWMVEKEGREDVARACRRRRKKKEQAESEDSVSLTKTRRARAR